jgi:hypothetical protein
LLPENPGGCFTDFLEFIYTGETTITTQTIAKLLKIAVFYGAASYVSIFRFFLREHATHAGLLPLVSQHDTLGLFEEIAFFVPELAKRVAAHAGGSPSPLFIPMDLYCAVSPPVFAVILRAPEFLPPGADRSEAIARMTDDYADMRHSLSESDRRCLAGTFAWLTGGNQAVVRSLFARHHYDWLPAEIAGVLQSRTLATFAAGRRVALFRHRVSRAPALRGDRTPPDHRRHRLPGDDRRARPPGRPDPRRVSQHRRARAAIDAEKIFEPADTSSHSARAGSREQWRLTSSIPA